MTICTCWKASLILLQLESLLEQVLIHNYKVAAFLFLLMTSSIVVAHFWLSAGLKFYRDLVNNKKIYKLFLYSPHSLTLNITGVRRSNIILSGFNIISTKTEIGFFFGIEDFKTSSIPEEY